MNACTAVCSKPRGNDKAKVRVVSSSWCCRTARTDKTMLATRTPRVEHTTSSSIMARLLRGFRRLDWLRCARLLIEHAGQLQQGLDKAVQIKWLSGDNGDANPTCHDELHPPRS